MIVELTRDTIVRFPKGSILEVSEQEAKRLESLRNAKIKPAPKKAAKEKK